MFPHTYSVSHRPQRTGKARTRKGQVKHMETTLLPDQIIFSIYLAGIADFRSSIDKQTCGQIETFVVVFVGVKSNSNNIKSVKYSYSQQNNGLNSQPDTDFHSFLQKKILELKMRISFALYLNLLDTMMFTLCI